MPLRHSIAATAACSLFGACARRTAAARSRHPASSLPREAGEGQGGGTPASPECTVQPVAPLKTSAHITAARVAMLTGDQEGARRNAQAMAEDMRRAMKLADAARPIDHEAARSAARTVPGVARTPARPPYEASYWSLISKSI